MQELKQRLVERRSYMAEWLDSGSDECLSWDKK